ncbi:hypothetical protein KVT40_004126 [Elsinoe batatas]|uniref:Uncharacterized protein n=1 Tax=Elsinoe batatas TaxID=2601811 RepID=A0A8K0L9N6_9PEZI|nr:hypothetical protein KVT40_004126 [Elsinoe batatas]
MSKTTISEKPSPPAYRNDTSSSAPAESLNTSPPVYDFTDSKALSASEEKKRLAANEKATNVADLGSSTPSSSSLTQTTWQIVTDSRTSGSFDVLDDAGTKLYRIQKRGRSPQIRLLSLTNGQQVGEASYLSHSQVVDMDIQDVKDVELRPAGKGKDYTYSSPSLMRRLNWHRGAIAGHVTSITCNDERGDEVAKWSNAGMSWSKVAKLEFARWMEVGSAEDVRRRKEEVLFAAAVMHFKAGIAAKGLHMDVAMSSTPGLGMWGISAGP